MAEHQQDQLVLGADTAPTTTERRHMLIEGVRDFDKRYPPGPSEVATAEEAVDDAIAKGTVLSEHAKLVQAACDQAEGAVLRMRLERKEKAQAEDEANGEEMLLPPQLEVTIQFDDGMGHWILKQKNADPFDDSAIWILEEQMVDFIEALTDRVRKHKPLKK